MSGLVFFDYQMKLHKRGDREVTFQVSRQGTVATKQYNLWVSDEGRYIIMERDFSDTADISNLYYTATTSSESIADAWTNKAAKIYVEYNTMLDNIT